MSRIVELNEEDKGQHPARLWDLFPDAIGGNHKDQEI